MGSGPGVVAGLAPSTEAIGPQDVTLVLECPGHLRVRPVNVKPVAFPAAIGPLDSITVAAIVDFRIGLDLSSRASECRSSLSSRGPPTGDPSSICSWSRQGPSLSVPPSLLEVLAISTASRTHMAILAPCQLRVIFLQLPQHIMDQ